MSLEQIQPESLLSGSEIDTKLQRVAWEILEQPGEAPLALVGIHTRGVTIAERLRSALEAAGATVARGSIDISLYRDDLDNLGTSPQLRSSDFFFPVDGANVLLCDDVLFTGRTIRAAIDALMEYGRPARVRLAVLIDRGNRELPIAADFVGETVETARDEHIRVQLKEVDGVDSVERLHLTS
ncbi:MAG: bifunctional pyr operon transcriptional regulator/uracil phosphoribosyltransferase PyrR [Verrucomicrobiota bacterium]